MGDENKGVIYQDGYSHNEGVTRLGEGGDDHHTTFDRDSGQHKSYDSDSVGKPSGHHQTDHSTGEITQLPDGDAPRPD